jgi:hypothetical protein
MALTTRKPTGAVPPPVILLEGETGSGRSWTAAELSASPKVGRTFWIELGDESTADQYGAIPNVRYEIVESGNPDGSWDWRNLYAAARDFRDETHRAAEAGELPPVLVVDQVGAVWDMLGEWADNRVRSSKKNQALLAEDPNAEIDITSNYWNDATARWRKLVSLFLTTKGVVILLSRGEEITAFENGKPTQRKTWKVAGQKTLTWSMPIWVRLMQNSNPRLIKLRAVTNGIRPGVDREQSMPGFTLERLIFERYGWDPATTGQRQLVPMVAGNDTPDSDLADELAAQIAAASDKDTLTEAWNAFRAAATAGQIQPATGDRLKAAWMERKDQLLPLAADDPRMTRMFALLGQAEITDRDQRLQWCSQVLGRAVTTTKEMTGADIAKVTERTERFIAQQQPEAVQS